MSKEMVVGGPDLTETPVEIMLRRDLLGNVLAIIGDYQMQNVSGIEQINIIHLKNGTSINLNTEKGSRIFGAAKTSRSKAEMIIREDKEAGK